ncbi:ADAMTS-like protein 3 [Talpa occidentalis]|uniref:ADAMTS-like protein 3 n=1 Tax=Talpa occidentalis TaxID=50954 RepID=UPI0023F73304|nr:ADAMTS-like protein 3 [Talpa occidentalis]
MASWKRSCWLPAWAGFMLAALLQAWAEKSPGAYFLPEFALSPQGSFLEDATGEQFLTYRLDDQTARNARSDEEKDGGWDAWGDWSDCSRTCGGGASYSLRRCLTGRDCEGQNIRYRTCSNQDCPPDAEDFRAQQCSAYNDVQYQGRYYEWLPRNDDPASPCALRCHARGHSLVVELAPKVLDGTRCRPDSLDMCISGVCQAVGCDRHLGSGAKEDHCGVCAGDGATCRLVRGQAKAQVSAEKREENVIAVPLGSRSVRITVKGPAQLFFESKTLQGSRGEHTFDSAGVFVVENTTLEFQTGPERQAFRIAGPLAADFIFKTRFVAAKDSVVQFFFYQPISHQWRQTDFFPCTATCGGGYQLNSAECVDVRLKRVVPDHYCHYYPENVKPKPKLKECGMDPCPASDGFKEVMPYDHFQPLPRWEHNPWTACSASCGGGVQRRGFVCVEESVHGEVLRAEEWKCSYAPRPAALQACNLFDCPKWVAMDWSQCTVTCGRGLRYRVVLCISHRGEHVGGCSPQLKMHIKEECVVPVPCHRPREKSPVEAEPPWLKQAQELGEPRAATEDPTFIPEAWSACSATCGPGIQVRAVRCRVLLAFTQTETELPQDECKGPPLPTERPCLLQACDQGPALRELDKPPAQDREAAYGWELAGFTPCTATCLGGRQDAIAVCVHAQTQQAVSESWCDAAHRPPAMSQVCNTEPCPPRWRTGAWGPCSATCGVGIQSRDVLCLHAGEPPAASEECGDEKPHTLRACSQYDCPPRWHVEDWQQCSRTCGAGTQRRRVTCRQLLTDGSSLSLPDELCPGPRASSHKSCARTECPPHLSPGNWSQCSVSCGAGTQRRTQVCQKLTAKGRRVAVSELMCRGLPGPPLVQPCQMPACPEVKPDTKPKLGEQGPQILGVQRVYIQTREEKRVSLTVGSRAYLLPNTSLVVRCPVRRFQKSLIRWEKDGRCLHSSARLGVTRAGALRIQGLAAPDTGTYQCVAGPARDSLVLKLIGTDNRLVAPPEPSGGSPGEPRPDADSLGATWHQMRQMWRSRNELNPDAGQAGRPPLLRALLGGCPSSAEASAPGGLLDMQFEAALKQGAYSMDAAQFDDLIRNMSRLLETGEVSDDLASQLIYQLVASLAPAPPARLPEGDSQEEVPPAAQLRGSANSVPQSLRRGHWGSPAHRPKAPVLRRSRQGPSVTFSRTVHSRIGGTVYITEATRVISLLCELATPSEATYAWTKDGASLQSSRKITWDGKGKMQIRDPTRAEEGVYGCSVASPLGSDAESSPVLFAEAPVILSIERNTSSPEPGRLTVVVGGIVEVAPGANVTIQCPVRGVPAPNVTWSRTGGPLGAGATVLPGGSLLLQSVSTDDGGSYMCIAANALGTTSAASTLRLLEQRPPGREAALPEGLGTPMPQTPEEGTAGNSPRWGHPAPGPFWGCGNWTRCSAACGSVGARVRRHQCLMADGQRVREALCEHLPRPPAEVQPCCARDCPSRWVAGAWSACSATCGSGVHRRQVTCQRRAARGTMQVTAPRACASRPRPLGRRPCSSAPCAPWGRHPVAQLRSIPLCVDTTSSPAHLSLGIQAISVAAILPPTQPALPGNCSAGAREACWRPGPWRPCGAACGRGVQSRTIHCVHARSCVPVARRHCLQTEKPASWRPCLGLPCDSTHPPQEPPRPPAWS